MELLTVIVTAWVSGGNCTVAFSLRPSCAPMFTVPFTTFVIVIEFKLLFAPRALIVVSSWLGPLARVAVSEDGVVGIAVRIRLRAGNYNIVQSA
jgi:hypothetical protein